MYIKFLLKYNCFTNLFLLHNNVNQPIDTYIPFLLTFPPYPPSIKLFKKCFTIRFLASIFYTLTTYCLTIVVFQSLSHVQLCNPMDCSRLPCPSLSPGVPSDSCPLSLWCHSTISSSITTFSSCPQSFLASGSFPMSQSFISGGQRIGDSASASVLPMNIQDEVPLGLTGLISQESSPTPQIKKHPFFGTQPSLWFNSHIKQM